MIIEPWVKTVGEELHEMEVKRMRKSQWRKLHNVDRKAVFDALDNDENTGFCIECGAEAYGIEPNARGYDCDECGKAGVYGAEEIVELLGFKS